ncbi:hypothetical protein G8C92_25685 [Paenibacillus donghaensis]|uniref:hypothetical protein n=1 Tax=Paenibacillus donghaensis TaxID=414771 RepID=UPI001883D57F|nr:hypothetical protein [Paenibacillus donghaensis]MBE9917413.1 hypothetical protein [Paenibacillus donghaensis]
MALLKDSSNKEIIREKYEELWNDLLIQDENKAIQVLEKLNYELLPIHQKLARPFRTHFTFEKALTPFKTHLTWIIPLTIIIFFVLAYVIFIRLSLWLE